MRNIPSAGNLVAHVEGDIEDVDGILKITTIRLRYCFKCPRDVRVAAERALESHADKCPAYQSVKGCIHCTWSADIEET